MIERSIELKPLEKKCSSCIYGHPIVAYIAIGNKQEDGSVTEEVTVNSIPVGQTRNCFSWFERKLFHPKKFIYPNDDDTCIKPDKYKSKNL